MSRSNSTDLSVYNMLAYIHGGGKSKLGSECNTVDIRGKRLCKHKDGRIEYSEIKGKKYCSMTAN